MRRRPAVGDELFDRVSRRPATVVDGTMIEPAIGRGLEFELAAVGLKLGEFLFRALRGGLEGFQGQLAELDGARDVGLGFFQADGGIPLAVGQRLRLARQGDFEGALVIEDLHAQHKLGGSHGVLLADENDFLGIFGDVVRLVHLGKLFEFLALVGKHLLAALEGLGGAFLAGLAAGGGEISVLFAGDFRSAADGCQLVRSRLGE